MEAELEPAAAHESCLRPQCHSPPGLELMPQFLRRQYLIFPELAHGFVEIGPGNLRRHPWRRRILLKKSASWRQFKKAATLRPKLLFFLRLI
jgi:hypothetical protein